MNIVNIFIKFLCDYFKIPQKKENRHTLTLIISLLLSTIGFSIFSIQAISVNNIVLSTILITMIALNFLNFSLVKVKQYFNLATYIHIVSYSIGVGYFIFDGGRNGFGYVWIFTIPILNISLLEFNVASLFNLLFAIYLLIAFQFPFHSLDPHLNYSYRYNLLIYFALLSIFLYIKELIVFFFKQKGKEKEQGLISFLELSNNLVNQVLHQVKHLGNNISENSTMLKKETSRVESLRIANNIQTSSSLLLNMANSLAEHSGYNRVIFDKKTTFSIYDKLQKILKLIETLGSKIELQIDNALPAHIHSNLFILGQLIFGITYKQTVENQELFKKNQVLVKKGKETDNSLEIRYLFVKYINDSDLEYNEKTLQRLNNYNKSTLNQIGLSNLTVLVDFLNGEIFYDKTENHDVIGFNQVIPKDEHFQDLSIQESSYNFDLFNRGVFDTVSFDKEIRKKVKNMTVLVMEHNIITQKAIVATLKKVVGDVDVATNGKEGLDMFFQKKYDLILVDTNMPILEGKDVVSRIRKIEQGTKLRVPIVALALEYQPSKVQDVLHEGADGWITKPFAISDFFVKIDKILFEVNKKKQAK